MVRKKKKNKRRKISGLSSIGRIKKTFFTFLSFLKRQFSSLPGRLKRYVLASLMFLLFLVSFLSFFNLSGRGGEFLQEFSSYWLGGAGYFLPLLFIIFLFVFLFFPRKLFFAAVISGFALLIGICGLFSLLGSDSFSGGKIGLFLASPLESFFGELVAFFVFLTLMIIGFFSFWHLFSLISRKEEGEREEEKNFASRAIKRMIAFPKFKVLKIEPETKTSRLSPEEIEETKIGPSKQSLKLKFIPPPLDLLEKEKGKAHSGDIKQNALIIKKTLENFGVEVSMAEVNIGPTVTQYTFKPAEGVRLSKITALANNLSLALAAHPLRIEAPIPGKSLVGVEVPNKIRSKVRLRDLLAHSDFQKASSALTFVLGRDVAGAPVFSDIARLPHLLVAGATGTGKTIFLNSLILSLLYQNGPATLRFVLIDPKRVEFHIYNELPHLLCPVVFDPQGAVSVLKWLVAEMERRFEVLATVQAKDIASFNEKAMKAKKELLPYIVLIIDELADLMAARGKEIEACVVRIAQMARAVGIHLVVATQRPSVEVLTGLIKANITSRISFQVATQFDSRTVLDMAGAEKLLGLGDLLYISAETIKPKRIQGAYVGEDEVKKVVDWITRNIVPLLPEEDELLTSLREFEEERAGGMEGMPTFDDPLYEDAREIVIRNRKASASLLQRRLQIGYARAARLLDMLEAKGVIGPSRGSKPRKVYIEPEEPFE